MKLHFLKIISFGDFGDFKLNLPTEDEKIVEI